MEAHHGHCQQRNKYRCFQAQAATPFSPIEQGSCHVGAATTAVGVLFEIHFQSAWVLTFVTHSQLTSTGPYGQSARQHEQGSEPLKSSFTKHSQCSMLHQTSALQGTGLGVQRPPAYPPSDCHPRLRSIGHDSAQIDLLLSTPQVGYDVALECEISTHLGSQYAPSNKSARVVRIRRYVQIPSSLRRSIASMNPQGIVDAHQAHSLAHKICRLLCWYAETKAQQCEEVGCGYCLVRPPSDQCRHHACGTYNEHIYSVCIYRPTTL